MKIRPKKSEIRKYYDEKGKLSADLIQDLIWYINHDPDPKSAMDYAAGMRCVEAAPSIAERLRHPDSFVRIAAVEHLTELALPQYAPHVLHIAKYDPNQEVRTSSLHFLAKYLNMVSGHTQHDIAAFLVEQISLNYHMLTAYRTILSCLGLLTSEHFSLHPPQFPDFADSQVIALFKDTYGIV